MAPISFGRSDPRYIAFLNSVGEADCRAKLKTFQHEILARRAEFEPRLADAAAASQTSFDHFGIHYALDFTVTEAPFTFWQYGVKERCAEVPPATATSDELFAFLGSIYFNDIASAFGDAVLDYYAPYFYQSSTELGGPAFDMRPIAALVTPGFRDVPEVLPPLGVDKPFRFVSMPIVATWTYAAARRMLLVYGQNDPWSSGAVSVRRENDSYRYDVPDGNHGSSISRLPEAERSEARGHLSRWFDVAIEAPRAADARAASTGATEEEAFESLAYWRWHRR